MIREPEIIASDDPTMPHQIWAVWSTDDDAPAHMIFWQTRTGRIVLKGIIANTDYRGRDMLRWLAGHSKPIDVVEVLLSAAGFWERMEDEGLIASWELADGFPSPLENQAVPFVITQVA